MSDCTPPDEVAREHPESMHAEPVVDDVVAEPAGDEAGLWMRWRLRRDPVARSDLLALHLPYARVIAAMTFARRASDEIAFDDCLQFARLGLLEAFERYEPGAGASFRTFAAPRMRGAVLDGIASLSERQQQIQLRRRLLRERTRSLVSGSCDEDARRRALAGDDAIAVLAEVGVGLAIGFMLEDTAMFDAGEATNGDAAYRSVALRQQGKRIGRHVDALPEQLRRVVNLHYLQGHSFEQVASEMGLSRGRVSQLHRLALQALRSRLDTGTAFDVIL